MAKPKRNLLVIPVAALVFSACGTPATATHEPTVPPPSTVAPTNTPPSNTATPTAELIARYEEMLPRFEYDPGLPFDIEIVSEEEKDGVLIQDVTYAAYNAEFTRNNEGRINAYIVSPGGNDSGSYAGVLFLHQLERDQNRKEFLEEAALLAQRGVIAILPDGILPWKVGFTGKWEADQENIISQVIEIRRSLDLLLAQPGIDPQRIGVVGHDYGAMHASLLAAVDDRAKTYVLMTGDSTYSNWALRFFVTPKDADAYRNRLAELDPINFIAHGNPASLFFQFGEADRYIPQSVANQLYEAANEPKQIKWYKSGHDLNEGARQDRIGWLTDELGLSTTP